MEIQIYLYNQDCNGDWGGNAIIDNCGDCVGGNTNLSACNQDCNEVGAEMQL